MRLDAKQLDVDPRTMSFIPGSSTLLVLADGRFTTWDLDVENPIPRVVEGGTERLQPKSTRFVPGTRTLVAELQGSLVTIDFAEENPQLTTVVGTEGVIQSRTMHFIPDSKVLVAVVDNALSAWNFSLDAPQPLLIDQIRELPHLTSVYPYRYEETALVISSRADGNYLHWWNMRDGESQVTTMQNRERADPYIIGTQDGNLYLWDARKPEARWVLRQGPVQWMAFRGNGDAVLAQTEDNSLLMWDAGELIEAARR